MPLTRVCPGCASTETGERFTIPEQMFGMAESFDYVTCSVCGTVYICDVPANLAPYYDSAEYYSFDEDPERTMGRLGVRQLVALIGRVVLFGPSASAQLVAFLSPVRQVRTLVSVLAAVRRAGLPRGRATRVLDVGAGAGTLVYALSLAGLPDVTGIDPFAQTSRPIGPTGTLRRQGLDEVDGTYDLVMMHHSLEHVPDPLETLTLARDRLSEQGRLLVRMPTVSSHAYEKYGISWIGCDAPRHLTLFTREGVRRLCERAGLTVESIVDDSNESQFWASEQFRAGIPLTAPDSHFVNPRRSRFSGRDIRRWRRASDRLNQQGRGDQAAWVLHPTRP